MKRSAIGILPAIACLLAAAGCAGRSSSAPAQLLSPTPTERIELEPGLFLRPLGGSVYVVTHVFPWPANSLLVEMADRSIVLVATPYTPAATHRLLTWAQARFGKRRLVAINNGYHVDNLGGNAALREAGVPIYGSDLTVTLLRERGEKTRQQLLGMIGEATDPVYAVHAALPYLPPDHVFPAHAGLVLRFGAEEVDVIYPGPSQAPDKLAVYFPSRQLLFGGCMILGGDRAGNLADADLESWPHAVEHLAKLPAKVVVPAHGDRLDAGLLAHTLAVLARTTRPAAR